MLYAMSIVMGVWVDMYLADMADIDMANMANMVDTNMVDTDIAVLISYRLYLSLDYSMSSNSLILSNSPTILLFWAGYLSFNFNNISAAVRLLRLSSAFNISFTFSSISSSSISLNNFCHVFVFFIIPTEAEVFEYPASSISLLTFISFPCFTFSKQLVKTFLILFFVKLSGIMFCLMKTNIFL